MEKQKIKTFLLLAMLMVAMFLFNTWQAEHAAAKKSAFAEPDQTHDLPTISKAHPDSVTSEPIADLPTSATIKPANPADLITIHTDVMQLKINKVGGDIVYLELPKYPETLQDPAGFVLLDKSQARNYIVQSGLLAVSGPDSPKKGRGIYSTKQTAYTLNGPEMVVDLEYTTNNGVKIIKRFTFKQSSYAIDVQYLIDNDSSKPYKAIFYGRLRRDIPESTGSKFTTAARSYTGAAVTTKDTKYKKLPLEDMAKKAFKQSVSNGWAAMTEHYFTSAWIPTSKQAYQYQSETFSDNTYSIGFVSPKVIVQPHTQEVLGATLYVGPRITEALEALAPGLDLTVDYGSLWWICQPIFNLLKWIHGWIGNWGLAIILTTVLIKLAFYKLSAASYKSMGNMRKLQPKMEELKLRCGDDKQKFGQAVMELYRKEKINPLGGCLPILVQIPVFIALYYVLLESVELRQAPFCLWLQDLSVKDPFYVLPLIMGASMFFQQKMNPAPPDPVQAKVMMAMPLVFTVLFLQFPSGLVLYWVVNNGLSILQQWVITNRIVNPKPHKH